MTQRAKLRRLAFIDLPSWSRGSRPFVLGQAGGIPQSAALQSRLLYNLSVAPVDAKGTTQDYLTHLRAIPVQIMAAKRLFFEGVKVQRTDAITIATLLFGSQPALRRRGGAGSMRIRPSIRLTSAPARVCFSLGRRPAACSATAPSNADSKVSILPSSADPSVPTRSIARLSSRSRISSGMAAKALASNPERGAWRSLSARY